MKSSRVSILFGGKTRVRGQERDLVIGSPHRFLEGAFVLLRFGRSIVALLLAGEAEIGRHAQGDDEWNANTQANQDGLLGRLVVGNSSFCHGKILVMLRVARSRKKRNASANGVADVYPGYL